MPHGQHGPNWLFNAEGTTNRENAGRLLARLGRELEESNAVQLEEFRVELPEQVELKIRHERTPHGALALKITLEWGPDAGRPESRGIAGLL